MYGVKFLDHYFIMQLNQLLVESSFTDNSVHFCLENIQEGKANIDSLPATQTNLFVILTEISLDECAGVGLVAQDPPPL